MKPKTTLDKQTKISVREFAEAVGASRRGVQAWLERQAQQGREYRREEEGELALSLEGAERYLRSRSVPRASERPAGWRPVKAIMLEMEIGGARVYDLIHRGALTAAYHGGTFFVAPDDAAWFLKAEKEREPLPGWVSIAQVSAACERSPQALHSFIKRHNLPVKSFKPPGRRSRCYIRERDAERYKAAQVSSRKYIPRKFSTEIEVPYRVRT